VLEYLWEEFLRRFDLVNFPQSWPLHSQERDTLVLPQGVSCGVVSVQSFVFECPSSPIRVSSSVLDAMPAHPMTNFA
jgi:hypothetical protein